MAFFTSRKFNKIIVSLVLFLFVIIFNKINPPVNQSLTTVKEIYRVTRVIDGDTIVLNNGIKVRYIGMDTPEMPSLKAKKADCFAEKAKVENSELVLNKEVSLEKDVSNTDQYKRWLRYVYVKNKDGQEIMVNVYLVENGYATLATYPPDVKYVDLLKSAQILARNKGKGLWSECMLK